MRKKTKKMRKKTILNGYLRVLLIACCGMGVPASLLAGSTEKTDVPGVTQQTVTISGTITDESGMKMTGVNIVEKGTLNGTMSDLDGRFQLSVSPGAVLVFTYIGYVSQEVPVSGKNVIQVVLRENSRLIDEVVVIGYGTQRKGDITSAISSVKAEDFISGKIQDAAELIKGKVAGLSITKSSGDPNASSTILLRGVATLEGNVSPLILVDGIPGNLNTVAPENIESIDVLKDASAAAIYGTRGANGVIIITTKSGKRDTKPVVNYSGYLSTSDFYKTADFMTSYEVRRGYTSFSDDGWDTDWLKAVTQKGFTNNHSLSINGGTKSTVYTANVTYRYEEGTIKKSDAKELKVHMDLTQYFFNDILKVNLNIVKGLHENSANNATDSGITNIYRQAVIHNPTSPIYNEETGDYYEEFGRYQYYNPVAMINELDGLDKNEWTNITGNITVEPIKGWKTNLMMAAKRSNGNYSSYTTSDYYSAYTTGYSGSAYKSFWSSEQDYLEATSSYDFLADKHRFSALAGYSYSYELYDGFSASNSDFPTDLYSYNNIGVGSLLKDGKAGMSSYKNDNKLIGFFGRVSYGYDNRYNVLVSVRREGSSKFGDNHKWGTFPAVQAGWTLSNEAFMKGISWIDNLKLRAGYGVTGVIPGSSYSSLYLYDYDSAYGNYLDENGNWVAGLKVTQNYNPNLKWEKTGELNIGVDFSFLDNRLSGAIDVYNKKTVDLLYWYDVPVPPNMYTQTLANAGKIRNRGIELLLNGIPVRTKDFQWNTTVTISHNQNKLLSLSNDLYETESYMNVGWVGDPVSVATHRIEEGKGIGNYWGIKSVGVTDNGIWLVEDPSTGEVIEYSTSLNTDDYRQYLGNGMPKVRLGWSNTFRYKDFDLDIQMNGQFGYKI
ncbi:MAG: SusC/RagA family TonB-linked outer membrane protein [Parabacteroides sp.]|nr:SusC/RagA family TonB-linked outer membrane protein [Parabacteroides sp.]